MLNYLENKYNELDFCTVEQGLDYIFARMGAIYGAVFVRHWEGVDVDLVRQVWAEECDRMLTYKPKLDYALKCMNADRPPSALAFKKLLNEGPRIPLKPDFHLEKTKTVQELAEESMRAEEARAKLRELTKHLKYESSKG
jgi:hypothetical protein